MRTGTKSILFGAHCWFIHPFFVALAWNKLYGPPRDWRLWVAFFVHDLGYWNLPNMDGDEGERHAEWGADLMHRWFDRGEIKGRWETVEDSSGEMIRVRWSLRDEDGLWLLVSHYPNTGWGQAVVESEVRQWNQEGRTPSYWNHWKMPLRQKNTKWRDFCLYHSRFYAKRDGAKPSRLCMADKLAVALEPWWLYLPRVHLSGEVWEYFEAAGGHPGSKYNGEPHVGSHTRAAPKTTREWFDRMSDYMRAWAYEHKDGREDKWTPNPNSK
jgi:hypothetical protein